MKQIHRIKELEFRGLCFIVVFDVFVGEIVHVCER